LNRWLGIDCSVIYNLDPLKGSKRIYVYTFFIIPLISSVLEYKRRIECGYTVAVGNDGENRKVAISIKEENFMFTFPNQGLMIAISN
jgi:hypothetical protein